MTKRTYFKATFTALVEEPDEGHAQATAQYALEAIRDYIAEGASGDPLIYRPELVSVEPYTGPDPFAEDDGELAEMAERARRAEAALTLLVSAVTAPDAFPVELPEGAPTPRLLANPRITAALRDASEVLGIRAPVDPATVRLFLEGLVKRPVS